MPNFKTYEAALAWYEFGMEPLPPPPNKKPSIPSSADEAQSESATLLELEQALESEERKTRPSSKRDYSLGHPPDHCISPSPAQDDCALMFDTTQERAYNDQRIPERTRFAMLEEDKRKLERLSDENRTATMFQEARKVARMYHQSMATWEKHPKWTFELREKKKKVPSGNSGRAILERSTFQSPVSKTPAREPERTSAEPQKSPMDGEVDVDPADDMDYQEAREHDEWVEL